MNISKLIRKAEAFIRSDEQKRKEKKNTLRR